MALGTVEQTAATAIPAKWHTCKQVSTASVSTATATTAKGNTRKRVSTANTSWPGGSHEGEMEAAHQKRGPADGANNNNGAIFLCQSSNMEHLQQTRTGGEYTTGKADDAQLDLVRTSNGG